MSTMQQQERRDYNDDIETTIRRMVGLAANIKVYYHGGGTAVVEQLADDFYFQFNVLLGLVSPLSEMKDCEEISEKIDAWLDRKVKDSELKEYLLEGVKLFKHYHTDISRNGLLSLPTRGR